MSWLRSIVVGALGLWRGPGWETDVDLTQRSTLPFLTSLRGVFTPTARRRGKHPFFTPSSPLGSVGAKVIPGGGWDSVSEVFIGFRFAHSRGHTWENSEIKD